jgi:predicted glycosyltransferase
MTAATLAASRARREGLLGVDEFDPDVIVVEHFRSGATFAAELRPMLAQPAGGRAPRSCAACATSWWPRVTGARARVCPLLNRYFDALLVHGDRGAPPRRDVRECAISRRQYTGYVTEPAAEAPGRGSRSPKKALKKDMGRSSW